MYREYISTNIKRIIDRERERERMNENDDIITESADESDAESLEFEIYVTDAICHPRFTVRNANCIQSVKDRRSSIAVCTCLDPRVRPQESIEISFAFPFRRPIRSKRNRSTEPNGQY